MKKSKIVGLIMGLFVSYVAAVPYITVYQMESAAQRHDGEALSEHIEFSSVRQSLKDQMNAMVTTALSKDDMKDNPFAALGVAFASVMIDKMVEVYVTPTGITQLMSGESPAFPNMAHKGDVERKPFANASLAYESLDKFVVKAKNSSSEEAKFVFRRRGIDWKLTEIIIPQPQ